MNFEQKYFKKYLLYGGSEAPHPSLYISFTKYIKYKNKYLNLLNGGGKGPFKFLVLNGNCFFYSNMFYTVGNNDYCNFNYTDLEELTYDLQLRSLYLKLKKEKFDAIIIDQTHNFNYIYNITQNIEYFWFIINKLLNKNGIILTQLYNQSQTEKTNLNKLFEKNNNFKPVYDLRFTSENNIYRIYQKKDDELIINNDKLYKLDDNYEYAKYDEKTDSFSFTIEPVEEKNQIEFLINRFPIQTKSNKKCTK